jgi:hypothetical protein
MYLQFLTWSYCLGKQGSDNHTRQITVVIRCQHKVAPSVRPTAMRILSVMAIFQQLSSGRCRLGEQPSAARIVSELPIPLILVFLRSRFRTWKVTLGLSGIMQKPRTQPSRWYSFHPLSLFGRRRFRELKCV